MSWLAETWNQHDAVARLGARIVALDFDELLADVTGAVGRVAAHFKLPLDSGWLDDIARSPVLTRYSKSPDFEYSPQRPTRAAAPIAAEQRSADRRRPALAGGPARDARGGMRSPPAVAEGPQGRCSDDRRRRAPRRWADVCWWETACHRRRRNLSRRCAKLLRAAAVKLQRCWSICAAWGVAQARNVDTALDHLARAAELGWDPALRELQLLARDSGS